MKNIKLKIALLSVYLITASLNAITANIPEMAKTFTTVPLYTIELIATIPSLFQMIGVLVGKPFAQKIGLKQSVLIGLLCCAIGGSFPLLIQQFHLLFFTRCVFGLGCGLITSVMLTMIVALFEGNERSSMIGLTGSIGGLGSAISSFTAGRLLVFGWHVSFAVYLLGFVVFAIVLCFVPNVNAMAKKEQHASDTQNVSYVRLILLSILSFVSTLLAAFFTVKESTLITTLNIGTAQNGSFAITLISLGSLLAGAMYGKLYAKLKGYSLVLFYIVSSIGLMTGFTGNLIMIYIGAFLIGWGLIAFTPFFQEKVTKDYPGLGQTATNYILVSQALGAFMAPYYGTMISLLTSDLQMQFLYTGFGYLLLAMIALKTARH